MGPANEPILHEYSSAVRSSKRPISPGWRHDKVTASIPLRDRRKGNQCNAMCHTMMTFILMKTICTEQRKYLGGATPKVGSTALLRTFITKRLRCVLRQKAVQQPSEWGGQGCATCNCTVSKNKTKLIAVGVIKVINAIAGANPAWPVSTKTENTIQYVEIGEKIFVINLDLTDFLLCTMQK